MNFSDYILPSNKKFGTLFSAIFLISFLYFYFIEITSLAIFFLVISVGFFICSFLKPELLLPLNKLWMRFGLLLGFIINPIILGLIFFLLFTPITFVMRLIGRDELFLKRIEK